MVADMLCDAVPGLDVQLVPIVTTGDRIRGPLVQAGGKGLFTRELEKALAQRQIDFAVHSAKDLPGQMPPLFSLGSIPPREDPRDALICREGLSPEDLGPSKRIGTGSARRALLAEEMFPGTEIRPIRGNVETRLGYLERSGREGLDAVVLAMAGLKRIGLAESLGPRLCPLCARRFPPAAGQGTLALQVLSESREIIALLRRIDDEGSRQSLEAERWVVSRLDADCHSCLGVHVTPVETGGWEAFAMAGDPVSRRCLRCRIQAPLAMDAASRLVEELFGQGVGQWFA
jgi:hydroxymethylbilane synthase